MEARLVLHLYAGSVEVPQSEVGGVGVDPSVDSMEVCARGIGGRTWRVGVRTWRKRASAIVILTFLEPI